MPELTADFLARARLNPVDDRPPIEPTDPDLLLVREKWQALHPNARMHCYDPMGWGREWETCLVFRLLHDGGDLHLGFTQGSMADVLRRLSEGFFDGLTKSLTHALTLLPEEK